MPRVDAESGSAARAASGTSVTPAGTPATGTGTGRGDDRQSAGEHHGDAVLLVVNRRARSGDAGLEAAVEALSSDGRALTTVEPDDPSTLAARIESAIGPDIGRVVVAGGDGTINAALPAVIRVGKPLGIIPLGTANDLARTLGLPTDPAEAAKIVLGGRTRRIDVGSVNGTLFVNAAGIGFSTELQKLPPRLKGWLGPLAYPFGVLRRWKTHRAFTVEVRGAGIDCIRRVIQVTVANGRSYGGGMTAHEQARIDDGMLDLLLVLHRPLWRLVLSALSFKRGVYDRAPVIALHGSSFEVLTRRPMPIAADGEISTTTPAAFEVSPQTLEVFVPDEPDQG